MKSSPYLPSLVLACCFAATMTFAAELRLNGVLGNSGEDGSTLVTFNGKAASGIGPVLDDANTLWERAGSTQLNRYTLDGRLLASFELPESDSRSDQMTRAGAHLLLKLRTALYALPLDAAPGSKAAQLPGEANVICSNARDGKVILLNRGSLERLDVATGTRTELFKTDAPASALWEESDGVILGFGEGKVFMWKDGALMAGFPKSFTGESPQKVGRYWFTQAFGGTVNRMNESFEPDPGVVLGGASGSFIGYMPGSNDLELGHSVVQLRDGLYAISGLGGMIQFLQWNEAESRFQIARRIGALHQLNTLALDAMGQIWTPNGSWRPEASCETPLSQGDLAPMMCAQAVVLNGKTLCLFKKHFQYLQLIRGSLLDGNGLSHFEVQPLDGFTPPEPVTGAAAFTIGNDTRLIVTSPDGRAFEIPITSDGRMILKPEMTAIPGLKQCTSLAWFGDKLLAADSGAVIAFQREGSGWKEAGRVKEYGGEVFIHCDGKRLVVSDPAHDAVHLFDALDTQPVSYSGLKLPAQVAVAGDRVAVYESGKQRLVKLERLDQPKQTQPSLAAKAIPNGKGKPAAHTDADFQDLSRPGGIPYVVALTPAKHGLTVSIRTLAEPAPQIELGVANEKEAFTLTNAGMKSVKGQYDFVLPAGEWSKIRIAAALKLPDQQERFGFNDLRAIHAPFNAEPKSWVAFDLETYRELVSTRKLEIQIPFDQPHEGKATVVIENEAGDRVRNLTAGRVFSAGRQTLVWDGLDDGGKMVAPGNYRWRGAAHEGIRPVYRMNFANGDEPTTEPWSSNHNTIGDATTNGERVFFAAASAEGGWALMSLDNNGKFLQGYEVPPGSGLQHNAIAADAQYLYCAQDGFPWDGWPDLGKPDWKATWKVTLARYDIKSGALVEWPDKQRVMVVDTKDVGPGSDLWSFNLGGLAMMGGRIYAGSRDEKAILVLDAATGKEVERIPFEGVRRLAAGKELFAATDRGVVRVRDGKLLFPHTDIGGITIAPNGDVLISDAKAHQIRRYSPEGAELGVIGTPGGPYRGKYDPQHMVNPLGITFGPDGKLWVTENRWNPKRVHAWNLEKKQVVVEKFGMPHYGGGGGGFDPENARRWIGLNCIWDVDVEKNTARPTHVLSKEDGHIGGYSPLSYSIFHEGGRTYVYARGMIALISELLPDGTLHDIVGTAHTHHFAFAFNWKPPQAYIDAFYEKWPEKRADDKPEQKAEHKPWARQRLGMLWVDRNGDSELQKEEFDFCNDQLEYAGASWGHQQNSLTLYIPMADKAQAKIVAIQPKGMLPNGTPDYPKLEEAIAQATPISLTPGYKRNNVATVRDRFGRFIFNSDPELNAYAKDGRHLWSYPNQWSDVHGSHDAPLPEPGMMQGAMAILGIAPLDDSTDVFFLNGNHGRCFLLSSDGLYLDEAFTDVRVSYLKNEYRLGGEIFGGSFARDVKSGKYYVQIGHGPYRIYELTGFDKIKRMNGTLSVSKEQIAAVERQNLRRIAAKQEAKDAVFPGSIAWDKSGRFKTQVDLSADTETLSITWNVQDESPWVNNGRDWSKLFSTGDTVDFQFATGANADPKRRDPVVGDKRLLIAPHESKPVAVLYDYRKPGGSNPIEFTSPWRGAKVDDVRQLPDAKIEVNPQVGAYTVKAVIPLASLGLTLAPGSKLRADFGVTFGDTAGTDTNLRSYWSNQSTGLVDDIPGEIMLSPNLWGDIAIK